MGLNPQGCCSSSRGKQWLGCDSFPPSLPREQRGRSSVSPLQNRDWMTLGPCCILPCHGSLFLLMDEGF